MEPLNLNRLTSAASSASDATSGVVRTPGRPETSWEQAFFHQQQQQQHQQVTGYIVQIFMFFSVAILCIAFSTL